MKKKKKQGGAAGESREDNVSWPQMVGEWIPYINFMGYLYTLMMFIAMVVVIATYAPLEYRRLDDEIGSREQGLALVSKSATYLCLVGMSVFVLHSFAGFPITFAGLVGIFMLLSVGRRWAEAPSSCPNNPLTKLIATAATSMDKQPVFRRVFLVAASVGGNLEVYLWYSFLLLDLIFLSPMLENVIKAVMVPLNSLILTTIVGLIVMYEYAIVAFYFFRKDYSGSCDSMLDCTTTTIYQGLRMDIGSAILPTGVHDDMHWYKRIGFDLTFFVVITTVLMNVIFGIIIDTFGSLRDETTEREHHMMNNTFISCIDRGEADKAGQAADIGNGFEFLEKVKQNRWSYLNFIFYLRRKNPVDYTGPETRITYLLHDDDVGWMPLTVCKLIEQQAGEEESEIMKLKAEMQEEMGMVKEELKQDLAEILEIIKLQAGGDKEIQKQKAAAKLTAALSSGSPEFESKKPSGPTFKKTSTRANLQA